MAQDPAAVAFAIQAVRSEAPPWFSPVRLRCLSILRHPKSESLCNLAVRLASYARSLLRPCPSVGRRRARPPIVTGGMRSLLWSFQLEIAAGSGTQRIFSISDVPRVLLPRLFGRGAAGGLDGVGAKPFSTCLTCIEDYGERLPLCLNRD